MKFSYSFTKVFTEPSLVKPDSACDYLIPPSSTPSVINLLLGHFPIYSHGLLPSKACNKISPLTTRNFRGKETLATCLLGGFSHVLFLEVANIFSGLMLKMEISYCCWRKA